MNAVLVPGLWMPAAAMAFLGARLERRGFQVRTFPYRGRSPFEANVERFGRWLRNLGTTTCLVGHSLGGVLIVETLGRYRDLPCASAVLLGAPVRGCHAGRRFGRARFGRWMMGACGVLWEERSATWRREAPLGVIAGTVPLGLGRAFGRLPGPNDGVVCVSETAVEGMRARALVPLGHSSLIVSGRVAALTARFLSEGRFE